MQCARCGGKGTVFGEGTASIPCPNCGGSGQVFPIADMMQGCRHNFPPDHVWKTGATNDPYWMPQPSKTLLDEFAMAAPDRVFEEGHHGMASFASSAYQYAAAMMKERARRDEMGNVKEVEK